MSQHPGPPYPPPQPPPGASESKAVNRVLAYTLGPLLVGPAIAVGVPFLLLAIYGSSTYDPGGDAFGFVLVAGLVLPFLLPVPLLFWRSTRAWGVGILIGVAVTLIVLGGLCAGFIWLLSQESH